MAGWCTWIAVLGCATVGIARADRLTLKDGRELVGKVVRVGDRVRLVGRFGEVEFDADEVAGVEQELTPWERWAAAFKTLRPGDLKRALELCELASELRVRSEIPKVLRRGADPSRLDPADPQLLAAVELCADHRLPELRIALLVLAADAQPAAKATLEAEDYHLLEGAWLPAQVYYPKIGYVQWEGSWYPPSQLPVLRAKRRLHTARGRVNGLRDAEQSAQKDLSRAQWWVKSAAARTASAEAKIAAGVDAVAARERDLDRAQATLNQAQAEQTALVASPLGCRQPPRDGSGPELAEQRERYRRALREREEQLDRLRARVESARTQLDHTQRRRDAALGALEAAR
ncbi:MAG: hypothetical protein KDD82_02010, partial [Planctomycetes bacterium]|nr:hypothetical protein [Planctomycetota bacterium]